MCFNDLKRDKYNRCRDIFILRSYNHKNRHSISQDCIIDDIKFLLKTILELRFAKDESLKRIPEEQVNNDKTV